MEQGGLVKAFILDGEGGGTAIGWPDIERWQADEGTFLWLHLDTVIRMFSDGSNRRGSIIWSSRTCLQKTPDRAVHHFMTDC